MARKRLNKKVAIVGSLVVAVLLLGCVLVLLRFTQNPAQYVRQGDEAFAGGDYQSARRYYGKAYGLSKDQSRKNDIMFKLADTFEKTDDWNKAVSCWNTVAAADTSNLKARENLVAYYYNYCDSGNYSGPVWTNVATFAGELMALKPSAGLYFKKGRAELEIGRAGAITDREKKLDEAIADLEEAVRQDPQMMEAYEYLFQTYLVKAEMYRQSGVAKQQADEAMDKAEQVAEQAIKAAPDDPSGYANKLLLKLNATESPAQVDALAPDFHALTERFPDRGRAYATLMRYYSSRPALFIRNVDKVVTAAERAYELEPVASNALSLCDTLYRRAYIKKDVKDIDAAIEVAKKAMDLPDVRETSGPRAEGNKRFRRLPLKSLLAICYMDKAMEWPDQNDSQQWVKLCEDAVADMEQIFGSGENPYVLMWHGIIAYAKGQKTEGRKWMYAAYDRFKATDEWNYQSSQSAYWLAKAYADSGEDGAVFEFLTNAIKGMTGSKGLAKPEMVLDFADMALKMRLNEYTVTVLDQYESAYGASERSQNARVRAYLASGKIDDAAQLLGTMRQDTVATLRLKLRMADAEMRAAGLGTEVIDANSTDSAASEKQNAALEKYVQTRIDLLRKIMAISPEDVEAVDIVGVCNYLVRKGQLQKAVELADEVLLAHPDDTAMQLMKLRLKEPDPSSISEERGGEMTLQVLNDISDPYLKAISLGSYYASAKDQEAAAAQYAKALEIKPKDMLAVNAAFDLAIQMEDSKRARELAEIAKAENLDECRGQIYEARLAMMNKDYAAALPLLNNCVEQRPVFSLAYLFRSEVNDKLGKEMDSISDAEKAASLMPLGAQATKQLAVLLNRRNEKLGSRASAAQLQEARDALVKAVAANPADSAMLSYYIQSISDERPEAAFANMQRIYRVSPTSANAVRVGRIAIKVAQAEQDKARKDAVLQVASSVLSEAYKSDPENRDVVQAYAECYRMQGQADKADALIKNTSNPDIQWRYYLNSGQLDQAKSVLLEIRKKDPENIDAVKGLVMVSERDNDREASLEYSKLLAGMDDSVETRLNYVQVLVSHSMSQEAYKELDALKAKYPNEYRGDLLRALAKMAEGKYAEAREITNQVLQSNQNDAGAWRLRGELDVRLGDIAQAISSLQKSKLIQDSSVIRLSLARAFLADGRESNAIEELRGAMAMEEGPGEAAELLEQTYIRSKLFSDLKALYDDILRKYPTNYVWLTKAAYLYDQIGEKAQSLDYYKQAWRASEEAGAPYSAALNGWLTALIRSGQPADAVAFGSRYADGPIAPIALINMAEGALAMRDKPAAMRYFEKALEKSVNNSTAAMMIIDRMYNVLGQEESTAWCSEKLNKDPNDIIANIAMYNVCLREGRGDEALAHGKLIIARAGPKTEGGLAYRVNGADVLVQMYEATHDVKYRDEAIKVLDDLMRDAQDRPGLLAKVWNNLAYMLATAGIRLDEALEYIRKAYDVAPYDGNILDTYAFVLCQRGQYAEAKEKSRAAVQIFEKTKQAAPVAVVERLGQIAEKLGEKQEAIATYKSILESAGDQLPPAKAEELNTAIKRLSSDVTEK